MKDKRSLPGPGRAAAILVMSMWMLYTPIWLLICGVPRLIHDLANIKSRPFDVGLTQLSDSGGAGRIVRQVHATVNYFVLTDDDLSLQT